MQDLLALISNIAVLRCRLLCLKFASQTRQALVVVLVYYLETASQAYFIFRLVYEKDLCGKTNKADVYVSMTGLLKKTLDMQYGYAFFAMTFVFVCIVYTQKYGPE